MSDGPITRVHFVNDDVSIDDVVRVCPDLRQLNDTPPINPHCNLRTVTCDPPNRRYQVLESRYASPDHNMSGLRAPEYFHPLTEVWYKGTNEHLEQVSARSLG